MIVSIFFFLKHFALCIYRIIVIFLAEILKIKGYVFLAMSLSVFLVNISSFLDYCCKLFNGVYGSMFI